MHYLFLLASARENGNSETLARAAADSLSSDVTSQWIRLQDHPLPAFRDLRHDADEAYALPTGNALTLLNATLAADAIVFAAPLYWYSLPAPAKLYLDHWSHWMRVPELDFRARMAGKALYLTAAMSGADEAPAQPMIDSLRFTAEYLRMAWGGYVMAHANSSDDVMDKPEVLDAARKLLQP